MDELRTARLCLRPFRLADGPVVHTYAGDPDVVRHLEWGPNSPADTEAFVSSAVDPMDGVHPFAVERSGTLIGAVELRVAATCDPADVASHRVLEKSG